jgi:GAF domain-containing protein
LQGLPLRVGRRGTAMTSLIRRLLAPPVFDDEEKTRVSRMLTTITLATVLYALATGVYYTLTRLDPSQLLYVWIEVAAAVVVFSVSLFLLRVGQVRAASLWFVVALWLLLAYDSYAAGGVRSPELFRMVLVPVFCGLLLGGRALIVTSVLTVPYIVGLLYAGSVGLLPAYDPNANTNLDYVMSWSGDLFLITLLLYLANRSIHDSLDCARRNERAQAEANRELEEMRALLEVRVAERTRDVERRSRHLAATVEVSRAAASILDAEELMWQMAASIQDHFELYHVGIFQIGPTGQWAVYRAGAGESGRSLAEQGFRLEVGGASIVGWCTARAQPRVVQDVRVETQRVDRPEVALTQSEAALPLIARGQVIGALSVQSDRTGWFDEDTVAALRTAADQVAVSLDNARLFTESEQALQAAQRAYGEASQLAWADLLRARGEWGYSYSGGELAPTAGSWQPEMVEAARTGQKVARGVQLATVAGETGEVRAGVAEAVLAVPLRVRDQVVGVLSFSKESKPARLAPQSAGLPETDGTPSARGVGDESWTADEVDLMETMAGQLSVALESAQLFEETQRRASRERLIGEVTARVRETLDVDAVLQTAIREVGEALGLAEVEVRMGLGRHSLKSGAAATGGTAESGPARPVGRNGGEEVGR